MGLNITQNINNYQFESKENLRNAAKDILNRNGASKESMQNILDKSVFNSEGQHYPNAQLAIIKASSQISMNDKLKETLKYLKSKSAKKTQKTPVLGELWNLFNNEEQDNSSNFDDIEIDYSIENIFAAA